MAQEAYNTLRCGNEIALKLLVVLLLSALSATLLSLTPAVAAQDRLALLIGNSRYEHAVPLRNPENDIELLDQALTGSGFKTVRHANLDAEGMVAAITDFVAMASRAKDPVVLFYFSGHGVAEKRLNYMLPVDAKISSAEDIRKATISFDDIDKLIGSINPHLQILIMDACRDAPFDNLRRSLARGLARVETKSRSKRRRAIGTVFAFSTNPENVALDGDTGSSPYAAALAEAMLVPGLKLEDVFKRVRKSVLERTDGKQEPWENASLTGDFYFQPPQATQPPNALDMEFWDLVSLVDSIESMKRYLDRFPDGLFAKIARQRMENMQRDFSYLRKAEAFPIIRWRKDNFDPCGYWTNDKMFNPYSLRKEFKSRIVYLDIWLPFDEGTCAYDHVNRFMSGGDVQVFAAAGRPLSDEYVRSTERKTNALAERVKFRDWGHAIRTGEIDIFFPAGGTHYSEYDFCEASCLYYRGLVRVREIGAEEYILVLFEQVDPAEVGLTWKFENTKQAAADTNTQAGE